MLPSVLWLGLHFALKHMAVKKVSVKECFIETALWLANVKSNRFGRRYIWNLQTRLTLHKVENPRTLKLSVLCVAKRAVCPCLSAGAIRGVMHECLSCTWVCPTHCRMNSGTVLHSLSLFRSEVRVYLYRRWPCTSCGMYGTSHCSGRKGEHTEKSLKTQSAYRYLSCWAWEKQGLCWSGHSGCEWFKGDSWITAFLFYFYSTFSARRAHFAVAVCSVWVISVCWVWGLNKRGKIWGRLAVLLKNGKSRKLQPGVRATFICFLFKISRKKWKGKQNFSIRVREHFFWLEKNGTSLWRKKRTDREVGNGCCMLYLGFSTHCF